MRRHPDRPFRRLPALLLVLVAGCATNGDVRQTVVQGTVLVDGEPLANGSISFFPTDGTRGPSAGAVIRDGKYRIEAERGVVVGTNRVEIRGLRATGHKVPDLMGRPEEMDELVEAVPADFNTDSTLVRTVLPGVNRLDFDLPGTKNQP
ncbi:MAG: hypothetical protein K2R98_19580 [Gemmataceae bacterium]|nr:hypothetical protein [Gemmataceae bacterium]